MINYFAHSKNKKDSGMDFYVEMIQNFAGNLIQNFKTTDLYKIDGIEVRVNQRGNIAFSEKNKDLILKIQEKTGYRIECH